MIVIIIAVIALFFMKTFSASRVFHFAKILGTFKTDRCMSVSQSVTGVCPSVSP